MNRDDLVDVIGMIDDDMIEYVDRIRTRKKKRKWIPVCTVVAGLIAGLAIVFANSENSNLRKSYIIHNIEFPESAGELRKDIKVKVSMNIPDIQSLSLYETSGNLISDEDKEKLCDIFDFDISKAIKEEKYITIRDKSKNLRIYGNGCYEYHSGRHSENEIKLEDNKAIEIAAKYLTENALLPEGFAYSGIGTGEITTDEKNIVNEKTVFFTRFIDGEQVMGDSVIMVTLVDEGEITGVMSCCNKKIEKVTVDKKNIISVDEAVKKLLDTNNFFDIDEAANKLEINNVKVMYWEKINFFDDETYLQPVYEFSGNQYRDGEKLGGFSIVTPAVKQ